MKIGAHISTGGGIDKAVDRAIEIGAEAIQIFVSSPRGWSFKPIQETIAERFKEKARGAGIESIFFHGIYLVSLGTPIQENLSKSIQSLTDYMQTAGKLDAAGIVFHTGSHRGAGFQSVFEQAVRAMDQVLLASPENVWLIIENSAGMGDHICSKFQEIGLIMKALASPRVKVCLDTQHLFAAGYNVAHREDLELVMEECDKEIGLSNIVAIHANDSKTPFASAVDRHENIGKGHIGLDGFRTIMNHPAFRDLPFLLEVPGEDGNGPDKINVDTLKGLREEVGLDQS